MKLSKKEIIKRINLSIRLAILLEDYEICKTLTQWKNQVQDNNVTDLELMLWIDRFKNVKTDVWLDLLFENNFSLIDKLHHVENKDSGFGTVIVPEQGFSQNDVIHNKVLEWLKKKKVNVINPPLIIERLKRTLQRTATF
jgi:hypothetical protein